MSPTELMEQALQSSMGLAVRTSSPEALRDACYKARRNLNGAAAKYRNLSFHVLRDELFIISVG